MILRSDHPKNSLLCALNILAARVSSLILFFLVIRVSALSASRSMGIFVCFLHFYKLYCFSSFISLFSLTTFTFRHCLISKS